MFERLLHSRFHLLGLAFALALMAFSATPLRAEIGTYILIDARTGAVLDEQDATRKWYPASLTKMMTAYVTFKAIREGKASLNSIVVQSANSIKEPPSKMGFKVGTQFTVETALKIIMIKSANDIAVALGEAIGGSEPAFIDMMNAEARRLGMNDTVFVNPNGLPDNRQITTARDMAILAQALRNDFPQAQDYYNHPGIKFGKKTLRSANREFLMRVRGANGMKTGYICNSGYNVAASVTRNGRTLIAVVLGAASGLERIAFTRDLMDKGFRKRSGRYNAQDTAPPGRQSPGGPLLQTQRKTRRRRHHGAVRHAERQKRQPGPVLRLLRPQQRQGTGDTRPPSQQGKQICRHRRKGRCLGQTRERKNRLGQGDGPDDRTAPDRLCADSDKSQYPEGRGTTCRLGFGRHR